MSTRDAVISSNTLSGAGARAYAAPQTACVPVRVGHAEAGKENISNDPLLYGDSSRSPAWDGLKRAPTLPIDCRYFQARCAP
jgi:hypothetical protein